MERSAKFLMVLKLLAGLIVILILVFWLQSRATIEISVTNPGQGNFTYRLLKQSGGKDSSIQTSASKINKLVSKGSYEILVTQGDKNYFTVIKTSNFFRKSQVSATLSAEKHRSFVGYTPAPCMYYDGVLYSYVCGSPFSSVNKHLPASSTLPTYIDQNSGSGIEGALEGMVKTAEGTVALLHPADAEGPGPHIAYLLDSNLKARSQVVLTSLDRAVNYSIASYKTGFVIYSSDLSKFAYYSSLHAARLSVANKKPLDGNLKPVSVSFNGNIITLVYSTSSNSSAGIKDSKVKNEVIIYSDSGEKNIMLNGRRISSAAACSKDKICLISNKIMSVYRP